MPCQPSPTSKSTQETRAFKMEEEKGFVGNCRWAAAGLMLGAPGCERAGCVQQCLRCPLLPSRCTERCCGGKHPHLLVTTLHPTPCLSFHSSSSCYMGWWKDKCPGGDEGLVRGQTRPASPRPGSCPQVNIPTNWILLEPLGHLHHRISYVTIRDETRVPCGL